MGGRGLWLYAQSSISAPRTDGLRREGSLRAHAVDQR
eukprot:COSAG06_NODE_45654_length_353_cov_0.610236_1_plen_36_part_10